MILNLFQGKSLFGIESEDSPDHVFDFRRHVIRKLQINVLNSLISFIIILSFERRKPAAKLIAENAQAPYVNALIVGFLYNHLWR